MGAGATSVGEDVWTNIINEIDPEEGGIITFEQFKDMNYKIL